MAAALAFVGKRAIEAFLQGRVEAYKNELEKAAVEHSVRFQRLHTERAESIKELYSKIVNLDEALHSTLRRFQRVDEPDLKKKVDVVAEAFNDLRYYFLPRRIFFERDKCELIDRILEAAKGVFLDITTYEVDTSELSYKYDRELLKERHEFWESARRIHSEEIAALKRNLEDEFRKILGIAA